MPQENVELLFRMLIDAYNGGDVEAMVELMDPEVEWCPLSAQVEGDESYRGRDGIRLWAANSAAVWDEIEARVDEVRVLDDTVLALGGLQGRFHSGVALKMDVAWVYRYRDGLMIWGRLYKKRAEAFEAVGLSE
jgi:ketosteroid isomerase-like protein